MPTKWRQHCKSLLNQWRFRSQSWASTLEEPLPAWPPPDWIKTLNWQQRDDANSLRQRLTRLENVYPLEGWNALPRQVWLESATVLDTLNQALERDALLEQALSEKQQPMRCLDVGSKNWYYAFGLQAFAQRFSQQASWLGVELDGGRRYINGYSRAAYGRLLASQLQHGDYRWQSIMEVRDTKGFDLITCFFPFVFEDTLLAWGLPLSEHQPQRILEKMLSLLAPGGVLVTVHLGKDEASQYAEWLEGLAYADPLLDSKALGAVAPSFIADSEARMVCRCWKRPPV